MTNRLFSLLIFLALLTCCLGMAYLVADPSLSALEPGANVYAGTLGTKAATGATSQAAMLANQTAGFGQAGLSATQAAAQTAIPAAQAGTGLIGKMIASPYAAPALIQTGGQLIGGVMQGVGARKEQKRQEQIAEDQKLAYDHNIGTRLWG